MPKVTFLPDGVTVEAAAGTTLLAAAQRGGARVGSACGGNCACSTCHVYVVHGLTALSSRQDNEEDILDKAFDVRAHSRLACQARLGEGDVVCETTGESRQAWLDEHPGARAK